MTKNQNGKKRSEPREMVIGDILWAYAHDDSEDVFEGGILDESKTGLSIFTDKPFRKGQVLKVFAKELWAGAKLTTVRWCLEVARDTYRSGLMIEPDNNVQIVPKKSS
jgi:hypothetical protein